VALTACYRLMAGLLIASISSPVNSVSKGLALAVVPVPILGHCGDDDRLGLFGTIGVATSELTLRFFSCSSSERDSDCDADFSSPAVQNAVQHEDLGAATAARIFFRLDRRCVRHRPCSARCNGERLAPTSVGGRSSARIGR